MRHTTELRLAAAVSDTVEGLPTVDAPDLWRVSEGVYDGRPLIARFKSGAPDHAGQSNRPYQIGIAIPLRHPTTDGLPPPEEIPQLEAIEDLINDLAQRSAVLVGVITTGGMREFVLYAADPASAEALHKNLTERVQSHDVQVMSHHDPDWSVYREFVQGSD